MNQGWAKATARATAPGYEHGLWAMGYGLWAMAQALTRARSRARATDTDTDTGRNTARATA